MKSLLVALMVLLPVAARAASPEDQYFAARDGYVAKLKTAGDVTDAILKQEKLAKADLEKTLRKIIGPDAVKGLSGKGKLNLDTLFDGDEGFGMLDGLQFATADGKLSVVVSDDVLLKAWVATHSKDGSFPGTVADALKSDSFYTFSISTDAAVSRYAEIPLVKPASATDVYAMLGVRSQDNSPLTPDEIFIAMVAGSRVYVVSASAAAKLPAIPACNKIWQDYLARSTAAYEKSSSSEQKDPAQAEDGSKLRDDGDVAFRKCFSEKAPSLPPFATLVKQAQGLVDRLPK